MSITSKSLLAVSLAAVWLAAGVAQGAAEQKVSRALEKPLKACNDAFQAKKFDEAIAACKQSEEISGRSEYDNFVINQLISSSYVQTKRYPEAYPRLKAVVESPYVAAANKPGMLGALASIAFQQKDYSGAVDWAEKSIAAGNDTADQRFLIATSYYLQNKFKECTSSTTDFVSREEKAGRHPTENALKLMVECQRQANDSAGQSRTFEKLVTYYPKPEYWQNAMLTLVNNSKSDERLKLQVYRLQEEVGTLKRSDQYSDMVQLAMDQGLPAEALRIIDQGMQKNIFSDERLKAQFTRYQQSGQKALVNEKEGLPKAEAEANRTGNGDLLVGVGTSYLFNGNDAAKAAQLIQAGITKGLTKVSLNDAYITLGLAYVKQKNGAEANKAFDKVDKNENYERLAKLWSLRLK